MANDELYIKELILTTIVVGIMSYYYFLNKPDSPGPTIHCKPTYCM